MTNATLHTDRLALHALTPQVIHELFRQHSEAAIKAYLSVEEQGFNLYKNMHEQGMETFRLSQLPFLLIEKATGMAIGECGFHTWNRTHHKAEVFYALRHDKHKRKGYVSEALPVVLRYGFEDMNLHRISAMVASNNIPSLRLLHKNGFQFEGTLREDYLVNGVFESSEGYALVRGEWEIRKEGNRQ